MAATSSIDQNNLSSSPEKSSGDSNSKYKGVRKRKWGKWVSEIRLPNSRERIWLGSYDTAEKAARAFDAALYCLRGHHASFNFPETPSEIVNIAGRDQQSLTPQEIQVVAARFAHEQDQGDPPDKDSSEETCYTSSSCLQVDDESMDWSFLNYMDSGELGYDNLGLYSGLDKMHSGEFYDAVLTATPFEDNNIVFGDEYGGFGDFDGYSQHSFLWNF